MNAQAETTNPLNRLAGRLEALRSQFNARAAEPHGDLDAPVGLVRTEIESLQPEARELQQPAWVEALRRLGVLTEVWECLAIEDTESAGLVAEFSHRALDHLIHAARAGQVDADLAWITQESSARWGSYLDLLSGAAEAPALDFERRETQPSYADTEEPALEQAPANLDLSALLSLFSDEPLQEPKAASAKQGSEANRHPYNSNPAAKPSGREHQNNSDQTKPHTAICVSPFSRPPTQPVDLDPEMREAFLSDLTDLFERIQTLVLEDLESPGREDAALSELGRCFHTLKGAAGSVGLTDLAGRIHELEDRLEQAAAEAAPAPIDLLHESIGYLESILYNLQQNRRPAAAEASVLPRTAACEELPAPSAAALASPSPAALPTSEVVDGEGALGGGPSDGSIRVSCERIDEMMDLVSELITRRILWAAQAETIKEFAATAQVARNRLMGSIDRLRGLMPARNAALDAAASEPEPEASGLILRLAEQADDLAALGETARAAAEPLADDADVLARVSLRLWDALQAVRVLPVRGLFHRLARVAREASRVEARPIEVVLVGEDVGLDRSVQDRAFEPLLHVVRNAVGHGIEPVEDRLRAGKPPRGRITIEARREGYTMLLKVQDDGRGLDYTAIAAQGRRLGLLEPDADPTLEQLNALVFQSGFSTRAQANAVAGRGVGMDVVAQEVARLHGTLSLFSQRGVGTTLTIRLPARLALEQAMVVRVEGRPFALPLASIELADQLQLSECEGSTVRLRDRTVPLLDARRVLGFGPAAPDSNARPKLLVVRAEGQSAALLVDAIDGPRELVIKPLDPLLAGHPVVAGTSLSPAGELVMVLDPFGVVGRRFEPPGLAAQEPEPVARASRALVVDDAISVRRAARRHLRALGMETDEAADGVEALRKVRSGSYQLILTDLDMPRMDGFELLAELNRSGVSAITPVLAISTRSDARRTRRVLELGARALLAKPIGASELAEVIAPLLASSKAGVSTMK